MRASRSCPWWGGKSCGAPSARPLAYVKLGGMPEADTTPTPTIAAMVPMLHHRDTERSQMKPGATLGQGLRLAVDAECFGASPAAAAAVSVASSARASL